MRKEKNITPQSRLQEQLLRKRGNTYRSISNKLGTCIDACYNAMKHSKGNKTVENVPRQKNYIKRILIPIVQFMECLKVIGLQQL